MTHTDPKAEEGAWLVARAAAYAVERQPTDSDAHEFLGIVIPEIQGEELKRHLATVGEHLSRQASAEEFAAAIGLSRGVGGYINHTVPVVIYCWLRCCGDFRATVEQTVLLGGDADTTGAIVGALAGASVGASGLPEDWVSGLWEWPRDVDWMRRLAGRLTERMGEWDSLRAIRPPGFFWPGIVPRNLLFFLIVLAHGFRRIFPPY